MQPAAQPGVRVARKALDELRAAVRRGKYPAVAAIAGLVPGRKVVDGQETVAAGRTDRRSGLPASVPVVAVPVAPMQHRKMDGNISCSACQ